MQNTDVSTRPFRAGDAFRLACNLRDQDRAELDAAGQPCHHTAIMDSVKRSQFVVTVEAAGEMVGIIGLAQGGTALAPFGVPWALGTSLVVTHRRALARLAPQYIQAMLQVHPLLRNLVHADNTIAVAWLRRVGFRVDQRPIQHPTTGANFYLFEMG